MKNKETIRQGLTKDELIQGFRKLGIVEGMILEVHSSLKSFGYVIGGAQAVVDALMDVVGYEGTLVMPLQSGDNTEPSYWVNPPIDCSLWSRVRAETPAFSPRETDIRNMGAVVNNFRRRQGVYFSYHPNSAFVAYGKYAKLICSDHPLNYSLSDRSPLGKLIQLKTFVLLLGVGYDSCTGMHLAEYRSKVRPVILQGGRIEENGSSKWVKFIDLALDSDEFNEPGRIMEENDVVRKILIGKSECRLFFLKHAVDITTDYLQKKHG